MNVTPLSAGPRITDNERARLQSIASPVRRAARAVLNQGRSSLSAADLQAMGMLAVWRKLPAFDDARSPFDQWAYHVALGAMLDVSRAEHHASLFEVAVSRGVQSRAVPDGRPAESDFYRDTPETDLRRLKARTLQLAAEGWIEAAMEPSGEGAPIERDLVAKEGVLAVREEVAQLTDEQRIYIRMRFWDDQEAREVAARLNVPERTLRRRWAETRDLLHARLRARGIWGVPEGFGDAADVLSAEDEEPRE